MERPVNLGSNNPVNLFHLHRRVSRWIRHSWVSEPERSCDRLRHTPPCRAAQIPGLPANAFNGVRYLLAINWPGSNTAGAASSLYPQMRLRICRYVSRIILAAGSLRPRAEKNIVVKTAHSPIAGNHSRSLMRDPVL